MDDSNFGHLELARLVADRCSRLFALATMVGDDAASRAIEWTRPLLSALYAEAAQSEELLDLYGARRNRTWRPLRGRIAGLKLFSAVAYALLHMSVFRASYNLGELETEFSSSTESAFRFLCATVARYAAALLAAAAGLGISLPRDVPAISDFAERLPGGSLPDDSVRESVRSVEETVVYLATSFLNVSDEHVLLRLSVDSDTDLELLVPERINEQNVRRLEDVFHGLQARYDTYVADTNLESMDTNLPVLRGHITVIYHLLRAATGLCHYYERHLRKIPAPVSPLVDAEAVLQLLVGYAIRYARLFNEQTHELCREMLRRYSVRDRVSVPVPRYRGFHVRPTTLIARIVRHYGAEVEMKLDDETYDAGLPFDLFRANEELNAEKRRAIAREAVGLLESEPLETGRSNEELVRAVARRLFEQKKLILYDRSLALDDVHIIHDMAPQACVVDSLNKLLNAGRIDLQLDISVTFVGDKRVLADIAKLADQNYGEDDFGNNLALPPELGYLRRGEM